MDERPRLGEEPIHEGLPPLNVVVRGIEVPYLLHKVQQLKRPLA